MKRLCICAVFLLLVPIFLIPAAEPAVASRPPFSLSIGPVALFPGTLAASSVGNVLGGYTQIEWPLPVVSARLSGESVLPFLPLLSAVAGFEAGYAPYLAGTGYQYVEQTTGMHFSAEAGVGVRYPVVDWLTLRAMLTAGYFQDIYLRYSTSTWYGNGFASARLGVDFNLSQSFSIGVGVSYGLDFAARSLFGVNVGMSFGFGSAAAQAAPVSEKVPELAPKPSPLQSEPQKPAGEKGRGLSIVGRSLDAVFPIFHA